MNQTYLALPSGVEMLIVQGACFYGPRPPAYLKKAMDNCFWKKDRQGRWFFCWKEGTEREAYVNSGLPLIFSADMLKDPRDGLGLRLFSAAEWLRAFQQKHPDVFRVFNEVHRDPFNFA